MSAGEKPRSGSPGGPSGASADIDAQRGRIDRLDARILKLLNARIAAAVRIGAIKRAQGLDVLDSGREAHVCRRLLDLNRGGLLPGRFLLRIYADLIAASRDVQRTSREIAADAPAARFALLGWPVGHSVSPAMHNAAFAASGYNGVYAAIPVREIRPAVAGLRALGFQGASVTIPHKQSVIECLDEVEQSARRINAVNTIVNVEGRLLGWNTDLSGAVAALTERIPLSGKTAAVLGAGGAARAVAYGVMAEGCRVAIFNRGRQRGAALAAELGSEFRPLSAFRAEEFDLLINTTPVGMAPAVDETPIPAGRLRPGLVVMDIVYNPPRTRLLQEAAAAGCGVIDGLSMFIRQGARQFELWTGLPAPVDIMRMAVEAELRAGA
ncbi:MAG: shikimate dehydrogenase [Desulfobacterales bacterium]|jgi:shikimate dehydrogenase|nr:shikimate dehydrogenase [Desulfobacterales bacterium]